MRFPIDVPLGQQSGQILFGKKTLRIRTNTIFLKTPETTADYDAIEAANAKIDRRRIARELNKARSMKGAQ